MISFDNPGLSTFTTPRQVMMGDGASAKLADLLKGWQVEPARVLLVADHEVTKLGLIDAIKEPLAAGGFEAAVFDAIVGEPLLETALDLTDFARGQAFAAVVGVGGGSAMDMAKLAAALATNHRRRQGLPGRRDLSQGAASARSGADHRWNRRRGHRRVHALHRGP